MLQVERHEKRRHRKLKRRSSPSILLDVGSGSGEVGSRWLEPRGTRCTGPVVVLTGPACASSNEAFLLMMRASGAKLVGERSRGSSGNPRPVELDNGVVLYVPTWQALDADGKPLEGIGIAPDVEVPWGGGDPVYDRALELLRAIGE